jgi:hypothetical protein
MYQKYVNSVPLYRQEKDWEHLGLTLSRATMAHWMIRCSQDYFKPVIDYLQKSMISEEVLHCDETPIQVLKEEGKKTQSKSYMWLYRTGQTSSHPIILYDYQSSRSGDNAIRFLNGFKGYHFEMVTPVTINWRTSKGAVAGLTYVGSLWKKFLINGIKMLREPPQNSEEITATSCFI